LVLEPNNLNRTNENKNLKRHLDLSQSTTEISNISNEDCIDDCNLISNLNANTNCIFNYPINSKKDCTSIDKSKTEFSIDECHKNNKNNDENLLNEKLKMDQLPTIKKIKLKLDGKQILTTPPSATFKQKKIPNSSYSIFNDNNDDEDLRNIAHKRRRSSSCSNSSLKQSQKQINLKIKSQCSKQKLLKNKKKKRKILNYSHCSINEPQQYDDKYNKLCKTENKNFTIKLKKSNLKI